MAIYKLSGIFALLSLSSYSQALLPSAQFQRRDGSGPLVPDDVKGNVIYTDKYHAHPYVAFMVGDTPGILMIDTAFGDLWVAGPLEKTSENGMLVPFSYPSSNYSEVNVTYSQIELPHFNLTEQPILWSQGQLESHHFDQNEVNITHGVLGLGPSSDSLAHQKNSTILSPFDHWVVGDGNDSPYLTILYTPSELDWDQELSLAGFISYGEIIDLTRYLGVSSDDLKSLNVPNLKDVELMPAVPVNGSQIIVVDDIRIGNTSLSISSNISGVPDGRFAAQVQSADPWVTLDKTYVDAIYGSIDGATWSAANRTYIVPCTAEVWVTIVIQEKEYIIDPLTTVSLSDTPGTCIGKFVAPDHPKDKFDVGLGTSFLASVYAMYGYQNASSKPPQDPYWKFLSIVDIDESREQFMQYRHSSTPSSSSQSPGSGSSTLVFPSSSSPSAVSFTSVTPSSTLTTSLITAATSLTNSPQASAVTSPSGSQSISSQSPPVVTMYTTIAITPPSPSTSMFVVTTTSTPTPSISSTPNKGDSEKTLVGNLGADDEDDKSLGTILSQVKYWIPSIIVGVAVLVIVTIGAVVFWAVNRRRRSHERPSAYKSLHARSAPVDVPLYGADEERGTGAYSDPYTDKV